MEITFKSREEATIKLLEQLPVDQIRSEQWLIVAVSINGVVIAQALKERLGLEVDILF